MYAGRAERVCDPKPWAPAPFTSEGVLLDFAPFYQASQLGWQNLAKSPKIQGQLSPRSMFVTMEYSYKAYVSSS